jgi:biopolymer transport protein ExbD/biopolymer transport protein TolR
MAYKPQVGAQMASPNVIPMADIMLVLLIIFMVVTPMLQKNMPVDMARADNAMEMQDADKDDAVVLAITRNNDIFLGKVKINKEEITAEVKDRISARLNKTVYVKSDARAKYGTVVGVVDEIRSAGVDSVGLLTEKNERSRPPSPAAIPAPTAD